MSSKTLLEYSAATTNDIPLGATRLETGQPCTHCPHADPHCTVFAKPIYALTGRAIFAPSLTPFLCIYAHTHITLAKSICRSRGGLCGAGKRNFPFPLIDDIAATTNDIQIWIPRSYHHYYHYYHYYHCYYHYYWYYLC